MVLFLCCWFFWIVLYCSLIVIITFTSFKFPTKQLIFQYPLKVLYKLEMIPVAIQQSTDDLSVYKRYIWHLSVKADVLCQLLCSKLALTMVLICFTQHYPKLQRGSTKYSFSDKLWKNFSWGQLNYYRLCMHEKTERTTRMKDIERKGHSTQRNQNTPKIYG